MTVYGDLGVVGMAAKTFPAEIDHAGTIQLVGQANHQIGKAGVFRTAGTDIDGTVPGLLGMFVTHCSVHGSTDKRMDAKLSNELCPVNMPKYIDLFGDYLGTD